MAKLTRRMFLARASIGTAAVGAMAGGLAGGLGALPRLVGLGGRRQGGPAIARGATVRSEAMVAHVRNFTTGEVALMVGTREIVYRDPELVAHLVGTARRAG